MKPTLLVLAAGMGSRYGSLKQLDGLGPSQETIIDYSVYDAIRAGFGKVVFIIQEIFHKEFQNKITSKFQDRIKVDFAFQSVNTPIKGKENFPERTKPWGTAHAVLVAQDQVKEPFAVVNADDFYGLTSLKMIGDFLREKANKSSFAMVGFELGNTLSINGYVSRGICEQDDCNLLTAVVERTKIVDEIYAVYFEEDEKKMELKRDQLVSMNLWGFHPSIFKYMEDQFLDFVKINAEHPNAEFFIPLVVNKLISDGNVTTEVLHSKDQWYGVTYKEDKPAVQSALRKMTEQGDYPQRLWTN